MSLPDKARVVIIGGGVIGCSVAYHLTKLGGQDVVLAGTQTTHLRHDLARSGPDRPAARDGKHDQAGEIFAGTVRQILRLKPALRLASNALAPLPWP